MKPNNPQSAEPYRPMLFRRRMLLVVVVLLVLAQGAVLSVVLLFRQARNEMEAMHKEGLRDVALAASLALSGGHVLETGPLDDAGADQVGLLLSRLRQETGVADIRLYDASGACLLGLAGGGGADELFDQAELWSAEVGVPAYTPPQRIAGNYFQTLYYPILDPISEEVRGIVAVQGNVRFQESLAPLRRWAILLGVGNGLVAVLLGLLFYWAQRRLSQLEARRQQAERLSAIGQLAAGVAHELRNPLSIIGQAVSLLRKKYDPEQADKFFDYIPDEVSRMNGLVKEFLTLAREQPLHLAAGDLAEVAERVRAQFEGECERRGVAFTCEADGIAACRIDVDRMIQVGLNLVSNALDAMPSGGKLSSRVGAHGREVYWSLSDTGVGIAPEQIPRLTEAFFTTRPEGTGLGLAIVERITTQHGGRLEISSRPGEGSTFTIHLPKGT